MMRVVNVFVYGTLRPGHRLSSWLDGVTISRQPAELHGARMYVPEGYWFPIVVPSDEHEDVVYGDLLMVEDGEQIRATVKMEQQAGYMPAHALVWAGDQMVPALTFVYTEVPAGSTEILSGDWSDWERMETFSDL